MKVRRLVAKDLAVLTTMVAEFEVFLGKIEGKRRRVDKARLKARLRAGGFGRRRFFDGLIAEEAARRPAIFSITSASAPTSTAARSSSATSSCAKRPAAREPARR